MSENTPAKLTEAHLARRVSELAADIPELADLTERQVDAIAKAVVVDELKADLRRAIVAERVDWQAEREAFLSDARSSHTAEAYARALDGLTAWLERHALRPSDLTPRLADDFIRDLRALVGRDADTVRLTVAACSSFFSFLERRFDEIKNPFRGSRARPPSTWTEAVIPSEAELRALQGAAEPFLAAALAVAIETGIRVGGLPELTVRDDGTWYTTSKGKRVQGADPLSAGTLKVLRSAGGDPRHPFDADAYVKDRARVSEAKGAPAELEIAWLKMRLARLCRRLTQEGKLSAVYSWHDMRHAFAQRHAARGLVWLRDRLGHASISVTERYLRNVLGVDTGRM